MDSGDLEAAEKESLALITRADDWLAVLRPTNPPPRYKGAKEHLIAGIIEVRNGAQDVATGLQNMDVAKLEEAAGHMTAGGEEAQHALDELLAR